MSETQSPKLMTIAIDAMGGDHGPGEIIPGLALALKERDDLRFLVFGDEKRINDVLSKVPALVGYVTVVHTDKIVQNDDKPSQVLRSGRGSSMRLAIDAVHDGQAKAVVSSGNTGALMAMAKFVLKTIRGIHRPALASVTPGIKSDTIMLDLGANVLVEAESLVEFAVMGAVLAKTQKKIPRPTVGLLNVGTEDMKGPQHVRDAAAILSQIDFPGQYYGFVEGDDVTKGSVDVIVCDGYAGNIALKTLEGTGKLVRHYFKDAFTAGPMSILGGICAYFSIRKLKKRMDPRMYNGGVLLGLNGICVKSHGGSDALAFSRAVLLAARLARGGYIEQASAEIAHLMEQESLLPSELKDKLHQKDS